MPFDQLKGRDFIGLLGGATAAWPLRAGARATESSVGTVESVRSLVTPFAQALNGLGYVEGK